MRSSHLNRPATILKVPFPPTGEDVPLLRGLLSSGLRSQPFQFVLPVVRSICSLYPAGSGAGDPKGSFKR